MLEANAVINRSAQTDGQTLVHAVILDWSIYFIYNKATVNTLQAASRSSDHVRYLFPSQNLLVHKGQFHTQTTRTPNVTDDSY